MSQADLYRLYDCATLCERATIEDNPHHAFAYARWIRRHVGDLLYEDLWVEPEEPPLSVA
jgi:hypothetical protein